MRKLAWILSALIVMAIVGLPAQESAVNARDEARIDQDHTRWIDHVIRSIATIKPGMTRQNLLNIFGEEGGLSTRTQRKYVYKHCPSIKVDVEFSPVDTAGDGKTRQYEENPDDKIIKISRPYLEYSFSD